MGAGLRLSAELLGPEYSMSWNTLDSGLNLFFSREVRGAAGEDLVEKQNAEVGLMPVVADEAAAYGYDNEDRHFVRAFLGKETPRLNFEDGLEVVTLLMAAYHERRARQDARFSAAGSRLVRAGGGARHVEIADLRRRIEHATAELP